MVKSFKLTHLFFGKNRIHYIYMCSPGDGACPYFPVCGYIRAEVYGHLHRNLFSHGVSHGQYVLLFSAFAPAVVHGSVCTFHMPIARVFIFWLLRSWVWKQSESLLSSHLKERINSNITRHGILQCLLSSFAFCNWTIWTRYVFDSLTELHFSIHVARILQKYQDAKLVSSFKLHCSSSPKMLSQSCQILQKKQQFWRIQHTPDDIFEESGKHRSVLSSILLTMTRVVFYRHLTHLTPRWFLQYTTSCLQR